MSDSSPSRFRRRLVRAGWCLLAVAGVAVLHLRADYLLVMRPYGVRLFFDDFDISAYQLNSRWASGEGRALYVDVESEYPPAANLIFAAVRVGGDRFGPFDYRLFRFAWAWMLTAWVVYVALLSRVAAHARWPALLLFVHPATIYFTLQRFDVYPVALTFLALVAARRDRHRTAALWFGLAVAVKGYPLFVLPAFAVFVWKRAGARRAAVACALAVAPTFAATAVVYAYAGADGVMQPYRFHAARELDSAASTYDAVARVVGREWPRQLGRQPRLANALQLAASLLAAGLLARRGRDEQFAGFVAAGLVSLVALTSASPFYSPQFVMWLLPFVAFTDSRRLRVVMHVSLTATLLFFPVAHDRVTVTNGDPGWIDVFNAAVLVVTVCRLLVGGLALVWLWRRPIE